VLTQITKVVLLVSGFLKWSSLAMETWGILEKKTGWYLPEMAHPNGAYRPLIMRLV